MLYITLWFVCTQDEVLGLLLQGILKRRRGAKAAAEEEARQAELQEFVPPDDELAEMWCVVCIIYT
jgi:hypothetical protein|eukprot:COSAG06_NODE_936_length_11434_cov_610.832554_9_plen_66_part_00